MTKEEVLDWEHHPVTEAFKEQLKLDILEGYQELKKSVLNDEFSRSPVIAGKIQAYEAILEMEITTE